MTLARDYYYIDGECYHDEPRRCIVKCIVRLCPNDDKDGQFTGPICAPCAYALRGYETLTTSAAKRILATLTLEGTEVAP